MSKLVVRDLDPETRARLEARSREADREAAAPPMEDHEPDERTYGYSIQGVLYEMADPDDLNPEGKISVEVDVRDGRHWVCLLDKAIAPDNLQDLWRTEVLVTGTATFGPRKALLDATAFTPLAGISNPVQAMEELIAFCSGKPGGEPVQIFMDRVRERDEKADQEASAPRSRQESLRIAREWQRRLAGRVTGDSADLIREDRDGAAAPLPRRKALHIALESQRRFAGRVMSDSAELLREDRER